MSDNTSASAPPSAMAMDDFDSPITDQTTFNEVIDMASQLLATLQSAEQQMLQDGVELDAENSKSRRILRKVRANIQAVTALRAPLLTANEVLVEASKTVGFYVHWHTASDSD